MIGVPLLLLLIVPADEPVKPKFPLGKETTYVTGPLDKEGYIDYEAALNKMLGRGITAETNAVVLFWTAIGPRPHGDERMPEDYFKSLGIKEPPEQGSYLVSTKDVWKLMPGEVDAAFEQLSRARQRPWSSKDYPHVAEWLRANEKPLAFFVEATRRPSYFSPIIARRHANSRGLLYGARLGCVQSCREMGLALAARAMLRIGEQRFDAAWADLLACHLLGRFVGSGGTLPEGLVGVALDAVACAGDLSFLQHAPLSAMQFHDRLEQLRRLQPILLVADRMDLCERINLLDALQHVRRDGPESLKGMGDDAEHRDTEWMIGVMATLEWGTPLGNANKWCDRIVATLRFDDRFRREKELAELQKDLFALRARATDIKNLLTGDNVGNVVISSFMPAFQKVQAAQDRSEQVNRNLHIAFALAAYRSDNHRYPAKLDELTPKYLATIPVDLFSGKPLIYLPTENGYLFYSVGVNGKDDGGRFYDDDPPGDDLGVRMPLPPLNSKK